MTKEQTLEGFTDELLEISKERSIKEIVNFRRYGGIYDQSKTATKKDSKQY
tara:strand:+ start:1535 stop:1687 length:153 start_codon:yes stop_codon:yes gene_type:complete